MSERIKAWANRLLEEHACKCVDCQGAREALAEIAADELKAKQPPPRVTRRERLCMDVDCNIYPSHTEH